MANWYVSSVDYAAVTAWAATTAKTVGLFIRPTAPTVGNERVYRCTTAGTTGGTQPTWPLTAGSTVTDGGVTWTEVTGQQTYQAAGAWSAPHARLNNAFTGSTAAEGDTFYVAKNHAETQSTQMKLQAVGSHWIPTLVVCVDNTGTGHVPPLAADWTTGASISMTSTSSQIAFNDPSNSVAMIYYGIHFTSAWQFTSGGNSDHVFDTCTLELGASADAIKVGTAFTWTWRNCTFKFGATGTHGSFSGGVMKVIGGQFDAASSAPTRFWNVNGGGELHITGFDLSPQGSAYIVNLSGGGGTAYIDNCKLASNYAACDITGDDGAQSGTSTCFLTRSGSSAQDSNAEIYRGFGTLTTSRTLCRTGGGSDDAGLVAHQVKTFQNANNSQLTSYYFPFECFPACCFNTHTATNVVVTMYGISSSAAMPDNGQVWLDIGYPGSSATPIATLASTRKANNATTGTALTADTSAWDSLAPVRVNSSSHAPGDIFAVASCPGQLFIVQSGTGNLAASLPGGYSGIADGGTVTDGACTVQAMWRWKIAVTLSSPQPQLVGPIEVTPRLALGATTTFTIIDPTPTLA
jgi:hypothetical protein